MGYTTDFVGNLTITPRLNEAEIEYLEVFVASRRCQREGGPYDVPGNPRAEESADFDDDSYNMRATGQPDLWCGWMTCWDGDCLTWSGHEKCYAMVEWLRYLIAHFLKPGGHAEGDPRFAGFSFNHHVNGMVVGCRRDTKELCAVSVRDNRVTTRVLNPGNPAWAAFPDLPYELENDFWAEQSVRRRRRRPIEGDGQVLAWPG